MRAIQFGLAIGLTTLALAAASPAQAQFMTNYPVIIVPPPPAENMIRPKADPRKPTRPAAPSAPSPPQESSPPQGSDIYQGRTRIR